MTPLTNPETVLALGGQDLHQALQQIRWDNDFQTMFEIAKMDFGIIGDNEKQKRYNELKEAFLIDFAAVVRAHPEVQPKIRFNDTQRIIEIGYAYDELISMLPMIGSKVARLIPKKKSPYLDDNSFCGDPAMVSPMQGHTLTKPGETEPFAYNALDPKFFDEVRKTMQGVQPSTYSLFFRQGAQGDNIIGDFAHQAQATPKPLRLFVGENHSQVTARRLIIESMSEISGAGAALCLEHFFYETQQPLLDAWIFIPDAKAPMPYELRRYTEKLDRQYGLEKDDRTGFKDVLLSAKQHRVRVVAIDTEAVRAEVCNGGQSGLRVPNMNYVARAIIAKEIGKGGFVGLVGQAHCAEFKQTSAHPWWGETTPGLDQLCNAASLAVREKIGLTPTLTPKGILSVENDRLDMQILKPDFLLETDPAYIVSGQYRVYVMPSRPVTGASSCPDQNAHASPSVT